MAINKYYLKARLFPTVLTSIPAILLYNMFVAKVYQDKLESISSVLPAITGAVLSSAIIYLLVQVNRFLSKEIFQRLYFNDEMYMPTTCQLLKSNSEIGADIKQIIERKIDIKFGIKLLSKQDELTDELRARKLIKGAVSQIRNSLRDNSMLLQHNIEYGFFRNLIGGSFLALLFSLAILALAYRCGDISTIKLGWILAALYLTPIAFSKIIISRYGQYYAKILYEQFISPE